MLTVLHVLTVGFQHLGVSTSLRKYLAQHGKIQSQRVSQSQAFGKPCGIDVHHHVDERFDLRRFAGRPDVLIELLSFSRIGLARSNASGFPPSIK